MAQAIAARLYFSPFSFSRGVSDDAGRVERGVVGTFAELYEEPASSSLRRKALESLDQSLEESSVENWDGYGAKPANAMSYNYARRFLESLLPRLPKPDVGVDPDGEISFEWSQGPRQVFSISVSPNGYLSYAGLFGRNEVHGTESFDDETPRIILDNLRRLFPR